MLRFHSTFGARAKFMWSIVRIPMAESEMEVSEQLGLNERGFDYGEARVTWHEDVWP